MSYIIHSICYIVIVKTFFIQYNIGLYPSTTFTHRNTLRIDNLINTIKLMTSFTIISEFRTMQFYYIAATSLPPGFKTRQTYRKHFARSGQK